MTQITLSGESFSANPVSTGMFATNYLTRSYDATPDGNFCAAMTLAGVTGLRFPGGAMTEESFIVTDPNRAVDDQGRKLTPLDQFLDFAQKAGTEVTIVLPTRQMFAAATDSHGNRFIDPAKVAEVRTFVTQTLSDLKNAGNIIATDLIKAFELGNEYWGSGMMTSTEYGRVVNALSPVIADAIASVLGPAAVGEIGIIAQMGGPWGSEFEPIGIYGGLRATSSPTLLAELGLAAKDFDADGKLTWSAKVKLSNTDIIEQITPAAKAAVTGLVEHFYLKSTAIDLTYTPDTLRHINSDLQIWRSAGFTSQNVVITEWNIQSENEAQFGLKGAGAFLFQFESMIQMGVQEAFTWPLISAGTTELAGSLKGAPYLTPSGAALQHMSQNLVGLHLLDVNDTTPGLEISAYGSDSRLVMYLSSREIAQQQLQADVSALVNGFLLATAEIIGVDMTTSDGLHEIKGKGIVSTPYYAEHDVQAHIRDLNESQIFDGSTITTSLEAFEVLMLVFESPEVVSMVNYKMAEYETHLTLGGNAAINGSGNDLANLLTGNGFANHLWGGQGNDTLIGNGGADTLEGGAGDDVYVVDALDTVIEFGGGIDLVEASFSYKLGSNIENLTLTGSSAINGTGNRMSNVLTGNSGNNFLDGGAGHDTMIGGAGNDIYYTNGSDTIIELAGEGIDQVISSVHHSLSDNIENLTLLGIKNINGLGNELANELTGNSGANRLTGGAGDDTLNGGLGSDTLFGGAGADCFVFSAPLHISNRDKIGDFNVLDDTICLADEIFAGLDHGALAASAFTANPFGLATSAAQRIIYETDTGKLFFDPDGDGSANAVQFALVHPGLQLTSEDFMVL